MIQEGRALGGKKINLPKVAPIETEAARLRLGKDLFSEAKKHIAAGEPIPDLLSGALEEWKSEAVVMAGQDDIERGAAWWAAKESMERALQTNMEARLWTEKMQGYMPALNVPSPVPAEDFSLPEIPSGMEGTPYELSTEARRRFSILQAPLEIREGSAWVRDEQGMEWELTEALAAMNQPEVREQLRQSLMGVIPGPPLAAHTVGAMPGLAQLPIELAGKVGIGENRRNVPTAIPGLKLPWLVGMGPGGAMRGDEEELMRDPVWARALKETIDTLDTTPTGWETLGSTLAFVADFVGVTKGVGLAMQPAAAGVARLPLKGALQFAPDIAKHVAKGGPYVFPGSTLARTAWEFMGYEVAIRSTDDNSFASDAWTGLKQGLTFGAVGKAASAVRKGLSLPLTMKGKVSPKNPNPRSIMDRLFPRMAQAGEAGRRTQPDLLMAGIRDFAESTFSKTIGKLEMAPVVRDGAKQIADSMLMGAMVHAYGAAQEAPPGKRLEAFWGGLYTTNAFATGFAFALNSGLQLGLDVRPKVRAAMETPGFKAHMREMARQLGSPRAESFVKRQFELFDGWREREPELFDGIVKMNPAAQRSAERTAKEDIELRSRLEAGDTSALIDLIGFPGREPSMEPSIPARNPRPLPPDALPAFRLMVDQAQRVAEVGAKKALEPTYTLGPWAESPETTQQLYMLGFEATKERGVKAHALNAVHEYLRTVEGNTETKYPKLADVPQPLFKRVLDWRDKGKPKQLELQEMARGAGENRPTLLDMLRARETPKGERLPVQSDLISKAGTQLTERGPMDADMAQVARELEALQAELGPLLKRGKQETFQPAPKDVLDMLQALRLIAGPLRRIPEQALIEGTRERIGELDALLLTEPSTLGPAESRAFWSRARQMLDEVIGVSGKRGPQTETPDTILRKVEGEPAYQGLAPAEKVAKAKAKPKRPTLGRALELVSLGKKTAEWLRENFPEGASKVGDGPLETWAGAFERAVREKWKADRKRRLVREGEKRERSIIALARRLGIEDAEHAGELKMLNETFPGIRKKGGLSLDDFAERLGEEGWFGGRRPTINETIDALTNEMRHPGNLGRKATEVADVEAAEMHAAQLAKFRDDIESGAEALPTDLAERQRMLAEVYAGDARFDGMDPKRIEREVMQLRGQAEIGDPGAMMAGPPETPADMAQRAAVGTRRLLEDLKAVDALDIDVTADSHEGMQALHELTRNPEPPPGVDQSIWSGLVQQARKVQADTRDALRESMKGGWDDATLAQLEGLWSYLDTVAEGREPTPEQIEPIKDFFDENGILKTGYVDRLQQEAHESLWREVKAREEEGGTTEFHSFVSPLAFMGRKFTTVEENVYGRMFQWQTWFDRPDVQKFLGQTWPGRVFKTIVGGLSNNLVMPVFNLGPLSRPQSSQMLGVHRRNFMATARERGFADALNLTARMAMSQLHSAWGGASAPTQHAEFFFRGIDDGSFARARGPEDFEAMRPGTGYLWPTFQKVRDTWEEVGRPLVHLGVLSQEQFDKLGGGRYMTHFYVREQYELEAAEMNQGHMPLKFQGRAMARENGIPGPDEAAFRPPDIGYTFLRGVHEETQTLRGFMALSRLQKDLGTSTMTAAQVRQLGAYDRSEMQLGAVRIETRSGESVEQAVERMARTKQYRPETLYFGGILTKLQNNMAAEGEAPTPGKTPWTKQKAEMFRFFFGESQAGPVFMSKTLMQEVQMILQETLQPQNLAGDSRIAALFDTVANFRKRGFTILRPSNWMLQLVGNVERNHVFGGVSRWDAIGGMLGFKTFTRDGFDALGRYLQWMKEGAPKEKPAGWTDADWKELRRASKFLDVAGPASSTFVQLGPEFAQALGAGFESPAEARKVWGQYADEMGARRGWTDDQREALAKGISHATGRMYRGLEQVDAKILSMLGENAPESKAKAFGTYTAVWNLVDIFAFKYPAYLKARHEWPDLPMSKVVTYALKKTGNGSDTHPAYRTFLSKRAPWGDQLWRAAQGETLGFSNARAKLALAQLLRNRFWMDPATAIPQTIRALHTHPIRSAGSLAILGAVTAAIAATMSDEEKELWREEAKTARRAVTNWGPLTDVEKDAFKRLGRPVGSIGSQELDITDAARSAISTLWKRVASLPVVPGPKHGGESRMIDLGELTPPTSLLSRGRALSDLAAVAKAGESKQDTQRFLRGSEQLLGMTAQAGLGLASGILGGNSAALEAIGGDGSPMQAIAKIAFDSLGAGGVMYPTLGMFSPEGQFIGESVALGGQRWTDAFAGIARAYNPQDASSSLLETGTRLLWPSRSVMQRAPLRSPVDGWTAILAELYPGFDESTAQGRSKLRAHAWVSRQMSTLFADLYEQHFDEAGSPGKADWTLDERVAGAFDEFWAHTVETPSGWQIEPGYVPRGTFLQAVSGKDEAERSEIIEHSRKWLSRTRLQEDGMTMLFELGRRHQLPKAVFREGFRNALEDPTGGNLVKWWDAQTEGGDEETLGRLAPLMWDVQTPAEGSEALEAYKRLMNRYTKVGMDWPPNATGSPEEVYDRAGAARALQGGPAFQNVIIQRPEANPLEQLLTTPR